MTDPGSDSSILRSRDPHTTVVPVNLKRSELDSVVYHIIRFI